MRALVFLVVVSYAAAAQLALPYGAPWVLPYTKLITTPKVETELKTVSLATPYFHPLGHHLAHPFVASPYAFSHALPYGYTLDSGLKATEFPYIYTEAEAEAEEEPAVEEVRRRRRDVEEVSVPLPYVHAVPAVAKATVETKQFEPVEAAVPASTTKIELTTKEHEISVPAVKYVQPLLKYKPVTYKTVSHPFLPYSHGLTYTHGLPFNYGFPYGPFLGAPAIKVDEE